VDEAEEFLKTLGMSTVRVRVHGDIARIEVPVQDMPVILEQDIRGRITAAFRSLGFTFISLDLEGFRSGNMNRALSQEVQQTGNSA
jgi:uncharacterized protein